MTKKKITYRFDVSITIIDDPKKITKKELKEALRKHFKIANLQIGYPTVWSE